jgi:hypothetical protein
MTRHSETAPRPQSSISRRSSAASAVRSAILRSPEGLHRPGDAVEPGVEGGGHRRGLDRLGQGGEVAQIGKEQRGADGLPGAAAKRATRRSRPASAGPNGRIPAQPRTGLSGAGPIRDSVPLLTGA